MTSLLPLIVLFYREKVIMRLFIDLKVEKAEAFSWFQPHHVP
jgi:hypothetical protein